MSSETDHPRQRTVAELLAAHGDGNVSGRRRRRRDPDEPEEGEYGAPAAEQSDWPPAPPPEPRRSAPVDGYPPAQREPGGRRRAGAEPVRAPERGADQWGAEDQGSDDWASERWDGGQWDEQDPWDTGRREAPGREARSPEPWDGPAREPRYADPEPRDAAPRRVRRAAEDRDPVREPVREAPSWEPREPAPSWDAADEPRRPREREAPAWEPRGAEPERNGRDPRARDTRSRAPRSWDAEPEVAPSRAVPAPLDDRAPADPMRDRPTDQMPRIRATGPDDPGVTSRIKQQRRRPEPEPDDLDDDGGPATMVGAAPAGSEAWHRARTEGRRRPPEPDDELDQDEGPTTMVGAPPPGSEAWHRARTEGRRGADGGPPTQASAPLFDDDDDEDAADYPAGLGARDIGEEPTGIFAAGDAPEAPVNRRSAQTEAKEQDTGGPAWAAVIAQWIAGAIGGAALWVGFRFLWRDLPVVALAAAVLVTVGLVVVVRALLRSSDLRTTLFAVLVGLLLTVSPAILVLLGR